LQKALAALKGGDRNWVEHIIEAMKLRAGLLIERTPEVFTFPHRTFQEYLAGAHLASQADFARQGCKLAEQGALWREALLMAVGRLVYLSGDTDKPLALVGELCPVQAYDDGTSWRKAWLAGDALLEIGTHRVADGALGRDLLERVRTRLVALIAGGKLSPRERAGGGTTLGRLGDPRFRADARYLPKEPLLGFVEIPEGSFRMGTAAEDIPSLVERLGGEREWYKLEVPQHEVRLPTYYISRYPVTVAQFRTFVEAGGYESHDEDSLRGVPNHPVIGVSWHDVLAYCNWLTETLKRWERTPKPLATLLREQGWRVMLPSEAEWERAARGNDGRTFPWGDESDPNRANYDASKIDDTSPVGCFPGGASPSGCHDMSGNVWEWTRSLGGEDSYRYPYDPTDGREDLKASNFIRRVLRGGAFGGDPWCARCAFRDRYDPVDRSGGVGFRGVVSPFFRTFDLLGWLLQVTNHFPRARRHDFTRRLLDAAFDLRERLEEANLRWGAGRRERLALADEALARVRAYLRLASRLGWLSPGQHGHAAEMVAERVGWGERSEPQRPSEWGSNMLGFLRHPNLLALP
jgi:formylglycine-generating enzyme required for sulfatase activity